MIIKGFAVRIAVACYQSENIRTEIAQRAERENRSQITKTARMRKRWNDKITNKQTNKRQYLDVCGASMFNVQCGLALSYLTFFQIIMIISFTLNKFIKASSENFSIRELHHSMLFVRTYVCIYQKIIRIWKKKEITKECCNVCACIRVIICREHFHWDHNDSLVLLLSQMPSQFLFIFFYFFSLYYFSSLFLSLPFVCMVLKFGFEFDFWLVFFLFRLFAKLMKLNISPNQLNCSNHYDSIL